MTRKEIRKVATHMLIKYKKRLVELLTGAVVTPSLRITFAKMWLQCIRINVPKAAKEEDEGKSWITGKPKIERGI